MKKKVLLTGISSLVLGLSIPCVAFGAVISQDNVKERYRYDKELHEEEMITEVMGILETYEWSSEYKEDSPWGPLDENEEEYPPVTGENGEVIRTAPLDLREKETTDRLDTEGWKWEDSEDGGTLTLNNCHFRSEDLYTIVAEGNVTVVLYGTNTIDVRNQDEWFRPVIAGGNELNLTVVAGDENGSLELVSDGSEDSAYCRYGIGADKLTIESGNIFSNVQFCDVNTFEMKGGSLNISVEEEDEIALVAEKGDLIFSGGNLNIDADYVGILGNVTVRGGDIDILADWGIIGDTLTVDTADRFTIESNLRSAVIGATADGVLEILNVGEEFSVKMSECEYHCNPIYPLESLSSAAITVAEADYTKVNEAVAQAKSLKEKDYKNYSVVEKALKAVKYGQSILGDCEHADGYTTVRKRSVDSYADAIYAAIDALEPAPEVEKVNLKKVQTWGYNAVKITWDRVENADGYRLYYAEKAGEPWKYVTQIADGDATSYVHTGRTTGETYTYYMRAYTVEDGVKYFGAYSAGKSGKAVPKQVKIVKAKEGKNQATLSWDKVNGASGYRIYYKNSENGKWHYVTQIGKGSTTAYTHKGIKSGKDYYYTMRAYRTVNGEKVFGAYASWKLLD